MFSNLQDNDVYQIKIRKDIIHTTIIRLFKAEFSRISQLQTTPNKASSRISQKNTSIFPPEIGKRYGILKFKKTIKIHNNRKSETNCNHTLKKRNKTISSKARPQAKKRHHLNHQAYSWH